jgi:hypothetical protein
MAHTDGLLLHVSKLDWLWPVAQIRNLQNHVTWHVNYFKKIDAHQIVLECGCIWDHANFVISWILP